MASLILSAFVLGIAGIDPIGALLLASAIAANVSKVKVALFTICVFVFTVITGVLLSITGTRIIENITSSIPDFDSSFWAYVNIVIVCAIGIWLYRNSRTSRKSKPMHKLGGSAWVIALAGILFGAGAVFDPTFIAVVSLAAQNGNVITIFAMNIIWILVSQILLFGLFIAFLFGKHQIVLEKSKAVWQKHKKVLNRLIYYAALLSMAILVVDTLYFIIRGSYLIF